MDKNVYSHIIFEVYYTKYIFYGINKYGGKMKMAIIIILIVLAVFMSTVAFFGGFYKVNLKTVNTGGEILVYENVSGAYNQANKISNKVYYELLNDYKIETKKGFGIYYYNPRNVKQSKLRSEVGCIVENMDNDTIEKLKENFQVKIIPMDNYLVVEFPYKGFLSIMVGMIRVYPVIGKYIVKNNYNDGPIMEIYDIQNRKIIYRKFMN